MNPASHSRILTDEVTVVPLIINPGAKKAPAIIVPKLGRQPATLAIRSHELAHSANRFMILTRKASLNLTSPNKHF